MCLLHSFICRYKKSWTCAKSWSDSSTFLFVWFATLFFPSKSTISFLLFWSLHLNSGKGFLRYLSCAEEALVMTVYILTASWWPDASLPTVKPEWDLGIRCHILQNNIYCTSLGCYTYIFNLHRWVVIHLPYCSKLWNLSLFYLARFFPCPYMVLWFFPC